MKKSAICLIIFINCAFSAFPQTGYRFDLAGVYGSHINNSKSQGFIAGVAIGEYYKPFYDADFFAGASFGVYKIENSNSLYYPLAVNVGYFGTKHPVQPVVSLGVGYGIHDYADSIGNFSTHESGGLYSSIAVGIAYNKWKSCPYVTIGYNNFSTKSSVYDISKSETISKKIIGNQFNVRFGFLMK